MANLQPENFQSSRRNFLKFSAAGMAGLLGLPISTFARESRSEAFVPVRAITKGPKHHWFGYYDKLEFDPTNRYVLSNQVGFEHRTPTAEDRIQVGMVDLQDNDKWIPLGKSDAWGWQQGCMLQWIPGKSSEVLWNDREDGKFVARILDVNTKRSRTLPRPIYTISPDGKWGLSADFARIQNMRPGYGYKGVEDPVANQKAPKESGVWRVNLETGESQLILSLADVSKIPHLGEDVTKYWHYFNHLLVSPDSSRFIVLHRWRKQLLDPRGGINSGFITRMLTVNLDGSGLNVLDPSGSTSHFIWRDPQHICAWTKPVGKKAAFYLFKDKTEQIEIVGENIMPVNGHNTYLPIQNNDWILNDTYPGGLNRQQQLYLYHVSTKKRVELGRFHSPTVYKGEWRCDLHPRSSNDGKSVVIDSTHGEQGRQLWLADISEIVERTS